ncbi:MAG: hypothetical protein JWR15_1394 [Prosthecobacter sp.]|nr:hypothetical protein [Prosthecobacter sp.]
MPQRAIHARHFPRRWFRFPFTYPRNSTGGANDSSDPLEPRKRINARPRNNIYMSGTGPGTGRKAIRLGWEINYNVVGQWLRIAGYSKFEAEQILAIWIAKSPSKWKTVNLDRQTWFWVGYYYADARQKGWNTGVPAPNAQQANH